jgi:integrase
MTQRADTGKHEVRWRENGHNRSKSFTRKADAERFKGEVRRARELGCALDLDRGKETLADFIGVYWRRYAVPELAEKTRRDYGGAWEKHIRKPLGGYRLRDISPAVVDEFKARLRAGGVGEPTIGKALTLLSGVFRQAVLWGRVDRNPLDEIRIPQPKRTRGVRPFAPEQVEAIRGPLLRDDRLLDATLVSVLAYAGLRPQEARALQWGDIGERTIIIERAAAGAKVKSTKTEDARTVRLLAPLARDLRAWREASGCPAGGEFVFPTARRSVWTDSDWRNWRKRVANRARRCRLGSGSLFTWFPCVCLRADLKNSGRNVRSASICAPSLGNESRTTSSSEGSGDIGALTAGRPQPSRTSTGATA